MGRCICHPAASVWLYGDNRFFPVFKLTIGRLLVGRAGHQSIQEEPVRDPRAYHPSHETHSARMAGQKSEIGRQSKLNAIVSKSNTR